MLIVLCYASLLLIVSCRADMLTKNKDLTKECMDLKGRGLYLCNSVEVEENIAHSDPDCTIVNCKASCCASTKKCKDNTILNTKLFDCISSRVAHKYGSCCILKNNTQDVVVPYLTGALGLLLTCIGLYFLVTMGSKKHVIYDEKPTFEYKDDQDNLYETEQPHLTVQNVLATDGDDIFWRDDEK